MKWKKLVSITFENSNLTTQHLEKFSSLKNTFEKHKEPIIISSISYRLHVSYTHIRPSDQTYWRSLKKCFCCTSIFGFSVEFYGRLNQKLFAFKTHFMHTWLEYMVTSLVLASLLFFVAHWNFKAYQFREAQAQAAQTQALTFTGLWHRINLRPRSKRNSNWVSKRQKADGKQTPEAKLVWSLKSWSWIVNVTMHFTLQKKGNGKKQVTDLWFFDGSIFSDPEIQI